MRQVLKTSNSKGVSEIPVPDVLTVPSYETDYTPTFKQPQSYIRSKPGTTRSCCRADPQAEFPLSLVSKVCTDAGQAYNITNVFSPSPGDSGLSQAIILWSRLRIKEIIKLCQCHGGAI